ncbi:MAG TPA: DUF6691 family protein [Candidatus Binatia bacterium]|nr:DUF6691 family protein [Candidatus Binatia bacterium]
MNALLASFVSGLVFALGLGISGMTQPAKVTAFLDFTGNWDPSLACVMIGAILVHTVFYRLIRHRPSPLFVATFSVPTQTDIDSRLVGGAALFGIGWGLSGFCPGPAVTSLASGHESVVIFVVAMVIGMYLYKLAEGLWLRQAFTLRQSAVSSLATPPTSALQSPQDF